MHVIIAFFLLFLVWRKGVWRQWQSVHTTILFFCIMELQYTMITGATGYYLWRVIPDLYMTRVPLISIYVFVIFPCTMLLYLTDYPTEFKKRILRIVYWVTAYTIIEWIGFMAKRIEYFHGWSIWHSLIFNIILFWGLEYHHRKPLQAYLAFLAAMILGIIFFHIPVTR